MPTSIPSASTIFPYTAEFWTAVFTGITALVVLGSLVISWMVYQQSRQDTGRSRPLILSGARPYVERHILNDLSRVKADEDWFRIRVLELYIYNRSAIAQTLVFTGITTIWPQGERHYLYAPSETYVFQPHTGGNVPVLVSNYHWLNLKDSDRDAMIREMGKTRVLLRVTGRTVSGHKVRHIGRATFGILIGDGYFGV